MLAARLNFVQFTYIGKLGFWKLYQVLKFILARLFEYTFSFRLCKLCSFNSANYRLVCADAIFVVYDLKYLPVMKIAIIIILNKGHYRLFRSAFGALSINQNLVFIDGTSYIILWNSSNIFNIQWTLMQYSLFAGYTPSPYGRKMV